MTRSFPGTNEQARTPPDPAPQPSAHSHLRLRLIATSDLHAQIFPYDYYADRADAGIGLINVASLVRSLRKDEPNSLLFDNGDFIQGNPMGDFAAQDWREGRKGPNPVVAAMNQLGYDAVTPGNHEFDYGIEFLTEALHDAQFPVVCGNVFDAVSADGTSPAGGFSPSIMLAREFSDASGKTHRLRIGVTGVLPPYTCRWNAQHLSNRLKISDIVSSASAEVRRLREDGADIVVVLCHSGIGETGMRERSEHAVAALAGACKLDAIIAGHTHLVFPGPGHSSGPGIDARAGTVAGVPVVMPGARGSHVGVIDLDLAPENTGWKVCAAQTRAIPVCGFGAGEQDVAQAAIAAHNATLCRIRQPIGRTDVPLSSFLSLIGHDDGLALVAEAQRHYICAILSDSAMAGLPVISAAAPFRIGARGGPQNFTEVPAGNMMLRHAADLYYFPNEIRAVKVNGAIIAEWLERSAGIFRKLTPGVADQPLTDPRVPGYNFDVLHGLSYDIDLSVPARYSPEGELAAPDARRIHNLTFAGHPVRDAQEFIVATNSYRTGGGGNFPGDLGAKVIFSEPVDTRAILTSYVSSAGAPVAPSPARWRFSRLPRTSAIWETSPRAVAMIRDLNLPGVEALGLSDAGFLMVRIHL